jgi:hypothetical protein
MIALPVLMIAAGAVLRWGIGDSGSTATDVIGIIMIVIGTVALAALVVSGRWWNMRKRSLSDSTRV